MTRYVIGIDTGAYSVKAALIDELGELVEEVNSEYVFRTSRPLWAESDPKDWWTD